MAKTFSLVSRLTGAAAAGALFTTSLAGPALAAPLAGAGFGALGHDHDIVLAEWQNKPGSGAKPGQGGKPGWNGKQNWQHGQQGQHPVANQWGQGGDHWRHGGGGHWQNGAWIPFAVGFGILGAAAAAAAYGAPPQPGMCWYYDDPYQTTGHWDYC